ncbi:S41 family peptidase [Rhodohalobacter sulfatireducens]|uniref:S41 family peptidase n=1 Tax=Rhodohalobacter sulfatireducens TaxID=2911366 RepID=A0ABS9KE88_9BACT|nr:S41 family peptidase [Rhodohalobacter sulfatireducens]MCG2589172.1 S41 family peptidase [Rhodohalobacter sulfatireducens]
MKHARKLILFISLAAILTFSAAFVYQSDLFFQIKKNLTIFSDVYKEVAIQYVDDVSPETLMQRSINSMLETLDPYTVFIDEGEQRQMEILSSGSYGGIGIDAGYRGDQIVIIAPLEGYPAQRAGLRPGDIIKEIDGVNVEGLTPEEVQQLTVGDIGSEIDLKVQRPGFDQAMDFTLTRERIEVKNIRYAAKIGEKQNFGYIQLVRFGQGTSEELRETLLEMEQSGSFDGLILDLRNNPGGLLNEAVSLVDKFIEPGVTVVETRGRLESHNSTLVSQEPAMYDDLPMIVLINSGSASASEVVAGALQDLDRALIVGETSFGKGLVQTVRPLSYNTSLKITVSKYYIPSGRSIQSIEYLHSNSGDNNRSVPDSLRRAFKTKNGRVVYDGNGIKPDIEFQEEPSTMLDLALQKNNRYFFFVNDLLANSENSGQLEIPSDLFDRFTTYLVEDGFTYETPVDQHLAALETNIDNFSQERSARQNVDELNALLRDYKIAQIYQNEEFIDKKLKAEWISQTKEDEERIKAVLELDELVNISLDFLDNPYQYRTELRP